MSIAHIIKGYTSVLFTYLLTYLLKCFNNRPNLVAYLEQRCDYVTWSRGHSATPVTLARREPSERVIGRYSWPRVPRLPHGLTDD